MQRVISVALLFMFSIGLCKPNHVSIEDFRHYVTYLEALNRKYDEALVALHEQSSPKENLGQWHSLMWSHIFHLLGLIREAVACGHTDVWVWTGEEKWGAIKFIGPRPEEAQSTEPARVPVPYSFVPTKAGGSLPAFDDEPLHYTRLVTYLTEEVERFLSGVRGTIPPGVGALPKPLKPKPPKPIAKPTEKPKPVEQVEPVPLIAPKPQPEKPKETVAKPKPKPAKPKPTPAPIIPSIPEDDDFAASPNRPTFGTLVNRSTLKPILLAGGMMAAIASLGHYADQQYLQGAMQARIISLLSQTRAVLAAPWSTRGLLRVGAGLKEIYNKTVATVANPRALFVGTRIGVAAGLLKAKTLGVLRAVGVGIGKYLLWPICWLAKGACSEEEARR